MLVSDNKLRAIIAGLQDILTDRIDARRRSGTFVKLSRREVVTIILALQHLNGLFQTRDPTLMEAEVLTDDSTFDALSLAETVELMNRIASEVPRETEV
jgi:hypothetical protein